MDSLPVTTYPCPGCGGAADLARGCPGCRRGPDPDAAEVIRLNGEIAVLAGRVQESLQTYRAATAALHNAQRRRDELAARVRAAVVAARPPVPVGGPVGGPVGPSLTAAAPAALPPAGAPAAARVATPPAGAPGGLAAPVRPETSTRTVQNLLFILGGLLLGSAAIVFTAVAWATVGVTGRAVILAAVTAAVLAVPPVVRARGLTATAETFAAVGLLLVLLDGYAAYTVDLFGVGGWPGGRYAALVGGASAAAAAGYARVTGLAGPWFAALLLAQPVLPLLAYDAEATAAGWSLAFAAVAAVNLAALAWLRPGLSAGAAAGPAAGPIGGPAAEMVGGAPAGPVGGPGRGSVGLAAARRHAVWLGYAVALVAAFGSGLVALVATQRTGPGAILVGGPLLVAVLLLVAAAVVSRNTVVGLVAGAAAVCALALAALRPLIEWNWAVLVCVAALSAALSGLAAAAGRWLPAALRAGPRIGGGLVAGPVALVTGGMVTVVALATVARSLPPWRAVGTGSIEAGDWQAAVAVPLVTLALVTLLPGAARTALIVLGGAATVLALPAAVAAPWWLVSAVDLLAALALLLVAVRWSDRRPVTGVLAALAGALLAGQSVLVSLARPGSAVATLGALLVAGVLVAGAARRPAVPAEPGLAGRTGSGQRRVIGGVALLAGLLAVPAIAGIGLFAAGASSTWQGRAALAGAGLVVAALPLLARGWPEYLPYAQPAAAVVLLVTALAPVLPAVTDPVAGYAAAGVLLAAVGWALPARSAPDGRIGGIGGPALLVSGSVLLVGAAVAVAPAVGGVLLAPYGWLGEIWRGVPSGTGLVPGGWTFEPAAAFALFLLTAAAVTVRWGAGRGRVGGSALLVAALPVAAPAVLVGLAAAGARWPVVPVISLAGGLGTLLGAARARPGAAGNWLIRIGVPLGAALAAAGLAGLLPTEAGTLAGLGAALVAAAVAGAVGRTGAARVAGWLLGVAAGATLATAASLAAGAPGRVAAFPVLGVAAAALALSAALRRRGRDAVEATTATVEAVAVEAAAHATAIVALLFTVGEIRYASAICTLWGVALGIRALVPGMSGGGRVGRAVAAAGCELLAFWLLLAATRVAVPEAYTLPAAALGLAAGWYALRGRPTLTSWAAYGPGLAAALLPSLGSVLVGTGQPVRRLVLGAGALVVVLVGARWRQQAPVVLGGAALAVLVLHETVGVWELLPRWLFLAAGGAILIALATTYERRRRDLDRLRSAVRRMG